MPKYIQLLLVEEPKELITKAIGAMTDGQVSGGSSSRTGGKGGG